MATVKFIDINSSNVFDGSQPYVFWFDEGQSVNIQYIKQICFVSKKQNVKVSIPSEDLSVFTLVDVSKINVVKDTSALDLDTIRTDSLISTGWDYNGVGYVHMIYINASSVDAGEFIGTVVIDGEEFSIGADFYIEDQRLIDDLRNFGVEIPAYVERAIYESNVHEPAIDNILMNRKWKELLLEYVNIIANKGSYNSLINSLKWFEWGDLVRIQELWKYQNYDKELFRALDLMSVTSDDIQTELKNYVKSTYIGLYAALDKLVTEGDEIEYEDHFNANEAYLESAETNINSAYTNLSLHNDTAPIHRVLQIGGYEGTNKYNYISDENEYAGGDTNGAWFNRIRRPGVHIVDETNPKLEKVSYMWGFRDLALKMALLGKYFSVYFMPIHLDLINATLENKVYTNALKILHAGSIGRIDTIDQTTGVYCDVLNNTIIRLEDVHAYVYPDTPFSKQYDGGNWDEYMESDDITAMGVDLELGKTAEVKTYVANLFGGVGAVMPVNFTITNKDSNRNVTRTILYDNDTTPIDNYNIYYPSDSGDIEISATILLKTAGVHKLRFAFFTNSGELLVKKLTVNVVDNSWQPFELYKIKRIDVATLMDTPSDEIYNIFSINNFVYSQQDKTNKYNTSDTFELSKYSQFLPYSLNPLRNSFGVNHVVKINTSEVDSVMVNGTERTVDELSQMLTQRGYKTTTYDDCSTPAQTYLLAVNPVFLSTESTITYYNENVYINSTEETATISITQTTMDELNFSVAGIDVDGIDVTCTVAEKNRTIPFDITDGTGTINLRPTLNLYKTHDITLHFDVVYTVGSRVYHIMDTDLFIQNPTSNKVFNTETFDITANNNADEQYIISEYRIFPLFHTLEKLEGDMVVSDDELVVVSPNIPMTIKNEDITATWTFINESSGKTISFKPKHYEVDSTTFDTIEETVEADFPVNQPIIYTIGDHVEKGTPLPRGYYSIKIEYSLDGAVINTSTLTHAFHKI